MMKIIREGNLDCCRIKYLDSPPSFNDECDVCIELSNPFMSNYYQTNV